MLRAYDTFLQSEVTASSAGKTGGLEQYRYECAHCGQEVYLAAMGSNKQVTHFRHKPGNNNFDCEDYLGQYGAIRTDAKSRVSKNERAEFYFDSSKCLFCLSIGFSEDALNTYINLDTIFELRSSLHDKPFRSLKINYTNFTPDFPTMVPLNEFSNSYYLSNTYDGIKRKHDVFNDIDGNAPTFFKIQNIGGNYKAKLVRSHILYTNIPYFVAYQSQHISPVDVYLPSEIKLEGELLKFETMGRKFLGKVVTITSKNTMVDSWLNSLGYKLEPSDSLTLLWPPAVLNEESMLINTDAVYLHSSFELQPHGNINIHSKEIKKISNRVSCLFIGSQTKIYKKNVETVIDKSTHTEAEFDFLRMVETYERNYIVPEDNGYFLFNNYGVTPVKKGQVIMLTPKSQIKRYLSGYLVECIYPQKLTKLSGECLLKDILSYYKRNETFVLDDFALLKLSPVAFQYIQSCQASGIINSAAKYFIKRGML